jgi:hypothetical protein
MEYMEYGISGYEVVDLVVSGCRDLGRSEIKRSEMVYVRIGGIKEMY